MKLRLSTAVGYANLNGLEEDMVMEDFQDMLEAHSGIAPEDQDVLVGEPPRSLQITRSTARKTIEQMDIKDGDIITVRPRNGGPAPSMVGLSSRRSMSRGSMSKMGSFAKKGSFVKLSSASQGAMGGEDLADELGDSTLDDRDPMFNDAFSPRDNGRLGGRTSFTGMPRAVSKGDVLAQEHSQARQDNPHSMPDSTDRGRVEAAAVPGIVSGGPRRRKGLRADPPGRDGGLGEEFSAPRPGRTDQGFGDWATAPDQSCACVNCMLSTNPGMSNEHANMGQSVYVARRVMPDDNSCLFSAVAYVMEGYRSKGPELRSVIASTVLADTATYNEAFLGKSPTEYAKWIKDPSKWGGAIELSILSQHYGREIAAYDIKTQRCDVYGEDKNYRERVMLLYDGLHYDALSIAAFQDAPEEIDVSVFDPKGPQGPPAHDGAKKLVEKAHRDKAYTDTASFMLRCQICQKGVSGEGEALEHAKATGHANFSEFASVAEPAKAPTFAPAVGRVNA